MRTTRLLSLFAAVALLAACNDNHVFVGGNRPDPPENLTATARWVLDGFTSAGQPSGYAAVDLSWDPPVSWSQEPFRVYGRRAGGSFFLIATVTSCTVNGCVYRDRNVTAGNTYEYYVATTNEGTNEEAPTDFRETVLVPAAGVPATPVADSAVALDNAAFVRWHSGGNAQSLWKYQVYLTRIDNQSYLYAMGETDSPGYVDLRATNGHVYGYRIAAVDTLEHVSALSAEITVAPRPDVSGELVYTFQTNAAQSGFRFQADEDANPIVAGTATNAQWRLERDGGGWKIVPLNGTGVVEFSGRTTALACGPGADAGCRAATRAPAAGYSTAAVPVNPEFSYIFRVTGSDGQPHYGVLRASILGSDGAGHDLMIFDWAYQTLANDVRLSRSAP
ncbi:MAG TPA: fibronectin type III domain-containing protein [Longimicrobium sp.]|nr:fibronectin type III domain-containing protein [Longimicrobium sp.]